MHEQVELCTSNAHFDDLLAKAFHEDNESAFLMRSKWKINAYMLNMWFMANGNVAKGLKMRRDKFSASVTWPRPCHAKQECQYTP
jgi:hypothetical protein